MKTFKQALVATTALTLSLGVANADENETFLNQSGDGNVASIDQTQSQGQDNIAGRKGTNRGLWLEQKGDDNPGQFSFMGESALKNQRSCWITHTSQEVHDTLKKGFDRSPLFNGSIRGTGPRYCPSIEDKIDRFSEKNSHQIFVEPEFN